MWDPRSKRVHISRDIQCLIKRFPRSKLCPG
jgi:hypothetical protein